MYCCPQCGHRHGTGEKFCTGCGRALPRFFTAEGGPSQALLAWSGEDGEYEYDSVSGFQKDAVLRSLMKIGADFASGTDDEERYRRKIDEVEELLQGLVDDYSRGLAEARKIMRGKDAEYLERLERGAGELLERAGGHFNDCLSAMRAYGQARNGALVEQAMGEAAFAMDAVEALDLLTGEAEKFYRGGDPNARGTDDAVDAVEFAGVAECDGADCALPSAGGQDDCRA